MNRRCEEAIEQVYLYLDDEMTWFRRQRLRRHLRDCPPCDCAFAFERDLRRVVRERITETPPPELLERLRAFLRENGVEGV